MRNRSRAIARTTSASTSGPAPAACERYVNPAGLAILNRNPLNPDFRDSGAIIVTAASSTAPHTRLVYGPHGHRIDCFACGLLPAKARMRLTLQAHIPQHHRHGAYPVAARQLFKGEEVGRVTWLLSGKDG